MKVKEILKRKGSTIYTTTPDTKILDAIQTLNEDNVGSLLVLKNDKLVGIVTERDVLQAAGKYESDFLILQVKDIMASNLITCSPDDKIDYVMAIMTEEHIRHLPVLDNDQLTGIISIGDAVKSKLHLSESEARELKEYIEGRR